jgi:RND family efflux transporter MFP subunit
MLLGKLLMMPRSAQSRSRAWTRYAGITVTGMLALAGSLAFTLWSAANSSPVRPVPSFSADVSPALGPEALPAVAAPRKFLGVILARVSADIAPRFEGRLVDVFVRLGDRVNAGAAVAIIDLPSQHYDLRVANAHLMAATVDTHRAEVELAEAEERLKRRDALAAESLSTREELATANYQKQLASTRVEAARAQLVERRAESERLQRDNADAVLKAPFDGIVAARFVDPGVNIGPSRPVLRLISVNEPFVRFAVPEKDATSLSIGRRVRVTRSDERMAVEGVIEKISPEIDTAARLIFVEARLPATDLPLTMFSGEIVRVFIEDAPGVAHPE